MTSPATWVFDVSPHPATRAGLRCVLAGYPEISFWSLTENAADHSEHGHSGEGIGAQPDAPDVILAAFVHDSGAVEQAAARWGNAGIVLLTTGESPAGFSVPTDRPVALLSLGVSAVQLVPAIRSVAAGMSVVHPGFLHPERGIQAALIPSIQPEHAGPLSFREHQVLKLVAEGLPNKTIAVELGISEHTVKYHVASLFTKLGAASRTEAVMIATRRGILTV